MFSNFKKTNTKRVGYVLITREIMPFFNEIPPITNKTLYRIIKDTDKEIVIGEKVEEYRTAINDEILYSKEKVLTQEGIPIIAKDNKLEKIKANDDFTKNGYKKDQIYTFSGMGYLENLKSDKKVICVTDSLVIFKSIGPNNLFFYNYKELESMNLHDKIKCNKRLIGTIPFGKDITVDLSEKALIILLLIVVAKYLKRILIL